MRMECSIKLELAQKLVITPQLRQALTILQLPTLELATAAEQALLDNPVLELADEEDDSYDVDKQSVNVADNSLGDWDEFWQWAEYLQEATEISFGVEPPEPQPSAEGYISSTTTLHDHLQFQLHLAAVDAKSRQIGEHLIGCIDDNGYLRVPPAEIAAALAVPEQYVAEVLRLIQTFDPVGVGARNLQECLRLQVAQRNDVPPLVLPIIDNYLDDVAACRFKKLAAELNCSPQDIQQAVDYIRTLDPKPGRSFGRADYSLYIVPDVTVVKTGKDYAVIVNDTAVPRLTINPYFRRLAQEAEPDVRQYVEKRINAALWLIKGIEQRRVTLQRVMEAIVDLQRQFFDYGPKFMRPLTMKMVADRLGIHESTVSRAIANKYAATNQGMFSLRSFFTAGIGSSVNGPEYSTAVVKQVIRELVEQEDSRCPLSDQTLANMLVRRGFRISRRTVAKYREELGILPSAKRKRY